jgi:DNA helicase II / ATP-dependent DNA helicase PcrA
MKSFDFENLNEKQKQAVMHQNGPLLIVAGPGTGKTSVIVSKILDLALNKNVEPKSILSLTFTDKASAEMQERLDVALPYSFNSPLVCTFHSFCEKILREFAIDIGLDPGFKILSSAEQ